MKKIAVDFQGWTVKAKNLEELLKWLGLSHIVDAEESGMCTVSGTIDKSLLKAYPIVLEDDGMGYGIKPKYITEIDNHTYYDDNIEEPVFNIFTDYKEIISSENKT